MIHLNNKFDQDIVDQFFEHDYHDRGMTKWQGFYLSDHTAALTKKKKQDSKLFPALPQLTLAEIGKVLATAYAGNLPVKLQLNTVDQNNQHLPTISTSVLGSNDETVIISDNRFININDIRNIGISQN